MKGFDAAPPLAASWFGVLSHWRPGLPTVHGNPDRTLMPPAMVHQGGIKSMWGDYRDEGVALINRADRGGISAILNSPECVPSASPVQ